jgi:phospholipid/cholesterol/gamma-HCH transport system substrate-binding protein
METRANHLLIGAFVLSFVVGAFGFVLWLAKLDIDREFRAYYIYFEGSVSGLTQGSDVLYSGIPVGSATEIVIDPDDPGRVRVAVELASTTPIREDSVATLEVKGITGVSLIQISGGGQDSPMLEALAGADRPVIQSGPGTFAQLREGAPQLIAQLQMLTHEAVDLLNEDNRQAVGNILANTETISRELAGDAAKLGRILDNVEVTSAELRQTAVSMNQLTATLEVRVAQLSDSADATLSVARGTMSGIDDVVANDLRATLADARQTAQSFSETGTQLSLLLQENREPINDFTAEGLYEFSGMIADMRVLMASLSRLSERLEADPQQFFFGNANREFQAK